MSSISLFALLVCFSISLHLSSACLGGVGDILGGHKEEEGHEGHEEANKCCPQEPCHAAPACGGHAEGYAVAPPAYAAPPPPPPPSYAAPPHAGPVPYAQPAGGYVGK